MPLSISRHELKYFITRPEAEVLAVRLRYLMEKDANCGPDGTYKVRSLYFDDMQDTALAENLAGTDNRVKYRFRCYNDDFSFIKLERKAKLMGLTGKRISVLDRQSAQRVISGELDALLSSGDALLTDFYLACRTRLLAPKAIIDYRRMAFMAPGGDTRITIDADIRTAPAGLDMFDARLATVPAIDPRVCVLEVKFDGFLPEYIQRAVQLPGKSRQASSKFVMGRLLSIGQTIER